MDMKPAASEPRIHRPRVEKLPYAALLEPIPGGNPCGESLRYDDAYDRLREYQREEDASLPQDVWQRELKRAQWPDVYRLSVEVLQSRTKDLQIAAWLTEALFHLHGIPGLIDGINLLNDLCARYWTSIHPQDEDGDPEWRAAPFAALDRRLVVLLRQVPITDPSTADASTCSYEQYEEAIQMDGLARRDSKQYDRMAAEGKMTRQRLLASASMTGPAFFADTARDLVVLMNDAVTLELQLDSLMGRDAPSMGGLRGLLEQIIRVIREIGGMENGTAEDAETGAAGAGDGQFQGAGAALPGGSVSEFPNRPPGPIVSRDDAYRRLNEAAEYLLRTEPHSPVGYLVKRAISWGRMDLSELLQEFIGSDQDLFKTYGLLGIREWTGRK